MFLYLLYSLVQKYHCQTNYWKLQRKVHQSKIINWMTFKLIIFLSIWVFNIVISVVILYYKVRRVIVYLHMFFLINYQCAIVLNGSKEKVAIKLHIKVNIFFIIHFRQRHCSCMGIDWKMCNINFSWYK